MTQPMEKQFTRGNLISIVATIFSSGAILVGGVTSVNRIDAKAEKNTDNTARIEAEVAAKFANWSSQVSQIRTEITSLQVASARTNAQYDALSRSLDEVKTSLREISTILRQNGGQRP
jgi:outer membrane murein-binding lipoprotein Lpp